MLYLKLFLKTEVSINLILQFRHFDVCRMPVTSSPRGWDYPLCDSAWSSNTFCKVPFPQEDLHSLREVTCVQGNSETLRGGVWNFKSHSCFLKIWCSGYIPDLLKRLTKIHSYFMLISNYLFSWRLSSESVGV